MKEKDNVVDGLTTTPIDGGVKSKSSPAMEEVARLSLGKPRPKP